MCFSGGGKSEAPSVVAAPSPTPTPTPTVTSPIATATARAKSLDQFRYGLASTIKTSAGGVTGTGADLKAPTATGVSLLGGVR